MDCSLPGSSLHGILQARVLDWVAICFSRGSSRPRNWTWVSCIAGRFFTDWAPREAIVQSNYSVKYCKQVNLNFSLPKSWVSIYNWLASATNNLYRLSPLSYPPLLLVKLLATVTTPAPGTAQSLLLPATGLKRKPTVLAQNSDSSSAGGSSQSQHVTSMGANPHLE